MRWLRSISNGHGSGGSQADRSFAVPERGKAEFCSRGVPGLRRVRADVGNGLVAVVVQEGAALGQHVVRRVEPLQAGLVDRLQRDVRMGGRRIAF